MVYYRNEDGADKLSPPFKFLDPPLVFAYNIIDIMLAHDHDDISTLFRYHIQPVAGDFHVPVSKQLNERIIYYAGVAVLLRPCSL